MKAASLGGSIVKAAKTVPKVSALGKIDFKYWAKHKVGDIVQDARGDEFKIIKSSGSVVVREARDGRAIALERSVNSFVDESKNSNAVTIQKIKQKMIDDEHVKVNKLQGHAQKRHVHVTDSDLRTRLSKQTNLDVASRFDSFNEYMDNGSAVICVNEMEIEKWVSNLKAGVRLPETMVLNQGMPKAIGWVLEQGKQAASPGSSLKIVLRYNPGASEGYTIMSSFPF